MSSVPFYAIDTSCRAVECPRSPITSKNKLQGERKERYPTGVGGCNVHVSVVSELAIALHCRV